MQSFNANIQTKRKCLRKAFATFRKFTWIWNAFIVALGGECVFYSAYFFVAFIRLNISHDTYQFIYWIHHKLKAIAPNRIRFISSLLPGHLFNWIKRLVSNAQFILKMLIVMFVCNFEVLFKSSCVCKFWDFSLICRNIRNWE